MIRLILSIYPFFFPTLYIRHFSGKRSWISRRIWIEAQVIFKFIFPLIVLFLDINNHYLKRIIVFVTVYFILETFLYLLSLIFLSDKRNYLASMERSIILILMNYLEITLDYAVVYKILNLISGPNKYGFYDKSKQVISSLECVYFSFVTSTTLGYGDYSPNVGLGQIVTILQSITMLVFIVLFVNYFMTNLKDNFYRNDIR